MSNDIYQAVTDRIIELLERGTVPWRSPIRHAGSGLLPTNLLSGRAYRGINTFLLGLTAWAEGYASPFWVTFRQARQRGGHVRKGEKGTLVVFWKQHATTDRQTGEPVTVPVLRRFTAFNTDQCEGLELPDTGEPEPEREDFQPIRAAAEIVTGYPARPAIEHRGRIACYSPKSDTVRMPEPAEFTSRESYYTTLFHELAHSTGHSKRLDRGLDADPKPFGSPDYSREELVAEFGAAFLAAASGISQQSIDQSAAYIDGWRSRLSRDPKLVIRAASAGQRAADWVQGITRNPTDTRPNAPINA